MRMVESKLVTCGSRVSSTSKLRPYTSVPPPAVAAAGAVVGAAVGLAAAAVGAGALVAAPGGVVGLATGAAVGAAGAAGAACWQAARPMSVTATLAQRRNSRRGIDDISNGPPHQRCACTASLPLARMACAMSVT